MNRRLRMLNAAAMLLGGTLLLANGSASATGTANPWPMDRSPGLAALAASAEQGRYAFVFFWKENNEATQRMQGVLQSAMAKMKHRADAVNVCAADSNERATVEAFGVDRAPMPLVVAVAPNGAITKAWPLQLRADQLPEGIVSQGTSACIKGLQDRKLVLLCVQNTSTGHNLASTQAAEGFRADARFAAATEVITLDPADPNESIFMRDLEVSPQTTDAVTILLAPPGQPIARFVGAVSTDEIVAKVTAAQSGCCPGGQCGPEGCCPGGNCGPAK